MKPTIPSGHRMLNLELWKLLLIGLASWLVVIAIPLLAVVGLGTSSLRAVIPDWSVTAAIILLTLTTAVSCILSISIILTLRPSSSGGNPIYTRHLKN